MIRYLNVKETNKNTILSGHYENSLPPGEVDITHSYSHGEPLLENISIRPGIKMIIANHECHQNLKMDYDIDRAPVSFCYSLSQRVHCTIISGSGGKKEVKRLPGNGVLAYLPQTRGTTHILPEKRIEGVSIHFNLHTFNKLFNESPQCLKKLSSVFSDPVSKRFYHQSQFSWETFFVLKQILECPYKGETRRLFYEAKSLELVALKLAELGQNDSMDSSVLSRRELDQIREAYHILLTNLDHPPSLVDLSRLVGTNRNRLNRGFKKIYGNTAFNILRYARLSKAWSLLKQTDLSISEIALSVGYNNQANFTAAFRKQFEKTPKTVRRDVVCNTLPPKSII